MAEQMQRSACMLVMEYVPGAPLFNLEKPFTADNLNQTAADLGRSVFFLLYRNGDNKISPLSGMARDLVRMKKKTY